MTDSEAGNWICGFCLGPLTRNPHPDAGKPARMVDVGYVWVCIPCLNKTMSRWAARAIAAEDWKDATRTAVIDVLCGQALADHLGDIRDEETRLWNLLEAPKLPYDDPAWGSDSAWTITKARLLAAGLPLPEHLDYDDD